MTDQRRHRPKARALPGVLWGLVGVVIISIGLGRAHRPMREDRAPAPERPIWVRGPERDSWLDPRTGGLVPMRLEQPGEGRLEFASIAPWQTPSGGTQAIGLWSTWEARGKGARPHGVYLGRLRLPERTLIDQVPLPTLFSSPPCWFPDLSARVLFACLDGRLYAQSYETTDDRVPDEHPRPVGWSGWPSPEHPPWVVDVSWPSDARLGGRLIASMRLPCPGPPALLGPSRLWWLQYDDQHATVSILGALDAQQGEEAGDLRFPVVGAVRDGSLILAYLHQATPEDGWVLRIAPLEFDPRLGGPIARFDKARSVVDGCLGTPPGLSRDGRTLSVVRVGRSGRSHVQRYDLARLLGPDGGSGAPTLQVHEANRAQPTMLAAPEPLRPKEGAL